MFHSAPRHCIAPVLLRGSKACCRLQAPVYADDEMSSESMHFGSNTFCQTCTFGIFFVVGYSRLILCGIKFVALPAWLGLPASEALLSLCPLRRRTHVHSASELVFRLLLPAPRRTMDIEEHTQSYTSASASYRPLLISRSFCTQWTPSPMVKPTYQNTQNLTVLAAPGDCWNSSRLATQNHRFLRGLRLWWQWCCVCN